MPGFLKQCGAALVALSASAAPQAWAQPIPGTQFSVVPSPCPSGMVYITEAEAQAQSTPICNMIGQWAIVEVGRHAGPGLSGSGYQCNFDPTSCGAGCTESVCKPGTGGPGGADGESTTPGVWAILTYVILSLYVVLGVVYQYHTQAEFTHPHVHQWKATVGLVQDGFSFAKAKYSGEDYKGYDRLAEVDKPVPFVPPAQVLPTARPSGPAQPAAAREPQNLRAKPARPMAAAAPEPVKKKKKKKKPAEMLEDATPADEVKKKKKKKKKKPADDDGEAKE